MELPRTLGTTHRASDVAQEAAAVLGAALSQTARLHLPGVRERHRAQLIQSIELATRALDAAERQRAPSTLAEARRTLALAHAARALDARHGAAQLSQSAQRAPTCADCEDGWRRVGDIVATCEASAREAARLAEGLECTRTSNAARAAEVAAQGARRLIAERNHAYTFHADPGFSFGEGWYLAAAAVLAGVSIQVEPDQPQTLQALRFLQDAGLSHNIVPYRSRPRANKALPDIVARAFRAGPSAAQEKLRAAFIGNAPVPQTIVDWAARVFDGASEGKRVFVWVRHAKHQPSRNSTTGELLELCRVALAERLEPVLIGDAFDHDLLPRGARDMTLFWKQPTFQGMDTRRAQLQLFELMKREYGLVGQVGVTTAGMDGPALMGLSTMYLTDAPNVRLGRWVGAVPGYEEVVRGAEHWQQIERTLRHWAELG